MKRCFLTLTALYGFFLLNAQTGEAPAPIAPYSQAVLSGNTLYISGQIPIDPATRQLVKGDIREQTRQVMKNIGAILRAHNMDYSRLVMCTIYLTDMDHYAAVNEEYAEFFEGEYPARVTVQVVRLPMNAAVEIASIAVAAGPAFAPVTPMK